MPPAAQCQKKLLIEFGTAEKITKSSEPFLWEKLVYENTSLKSRVNELVGERQMLQLKYEKQLRELERRAEGLREERDRPDRDSQQLRAKVDELEQKLARQRLRGSKLAATKEGLELERQQFGEFVDAANYKYGRVGDMQQEILQLREDKKVYKQRNNEAMLLSFQEKFPHYHGAVFDTLEVYKQMERFRAGQSEPGQSDRILLDLAKSVTRFLCRAAEKVGDWLECVFYGKAAYHPSNLQLVEAMLRKWRNSSQSELHDEVRLRQKQLAELTRQYEKMCGLLEEKERYISKLEGNLHVTLERNRQLEELLKYNAHDFGYTLFYKLRRWEEENGKIPDTASEASHPDADPSLVPPSVLLQPELVHLKAVIAALKTECEFNKSLTQQQKQQQEARESKEVEKHVVQNKAQYGRPKRSVVVLKKNVYGYWEDPVFNVCKPKPRRQYQRSLSKYTQTTWDASEAVRLFFRVTVYNGNLRVTNIKIDPYVKLLYSLMERRTTAKSGREPFWNEGFTFEQAQPFIAVELYDKNKLGRDTFMGKATVDLSKVFLDNDAEEVRVEARIEDEAKGFTGRVWLGFAMLERQKVIHIEEIEAEIDTETDFLGEIDPYLQFKTQNLVLDKTPILRNAGRKPTWRQEFLLCIK